MNAELRVGDRVVLSDCSGSPGTVLEQRRGKLLVSFDDLPAVKWVLHSTSFEAGDGDRQNAFLTTKGFS
jgi:hypothetical protein